MTVPDDSGVAARRRELRTELEAARQALDPAMYTQACDAVVGHLIALVDSLGPRNLAFYWQHRRECDVRKVARRMIELGGQAALPVIVEKRQPLQFRAWHPEAEMALGPLDIPYPAGGAELVPDIVLAPLLGFDRAGFRLGYGGGYYDRTLAALTTPHVTIGVGFELGCVDTIDPQPHDIPMDCIVTEHGVFRPD